MKTDTIDVVTIAFLRGRSKSVPTKGFVDFIGFVGWLYCLLAPNGPQEEVRILLR